MAKEKKFVWGEEIKGFWQGDMVLSLADLIAVKNGLKNVFRGQISQEQDRLEYKEACEKWGLRMVVSEEKLLGSYNIYISSSKAAAAEARDIDPSFKIIKEKKDFTEVLKEFRRFSELLSYPPCCVEHYLESVMSSVTLERAEMFNKLPAKISFLMNGFLNGVSNHYLSFHLPCSFSCRATLNYHKKILASVKKDSPDFYRELVGYLKNPLLIFLDSSLSNLYVSWDQRQGFMLDGQAAKGQIVYKRALYLKTNYPDFQEASRGGVSIKAVKKALAEGERIVFSPGGFKVFKKKRRLLTWQNDGNLKYYFLNFV